ncbi:MAG TPA: hypothetical protein DHV70_03860 [Firmicutes bacterium]|jgi:hypothetical protein|nr:hypothetical protein [Bacillota bacterium]
MFEFFDPLKRKYNEWRRIKVTKEIYTGSKENCKEGNLILINESSDDSKYRVIDKLNFNEELVESLPDIDSGMQEIIKSFYCSELYYNKVLKYIDPIELLEELGDNPILVSSKESKEFDYRHLVALYLELFLGIKSKEILIDENGNIKNIPRPDYLKSMLESVIKRNYPMNGFDNIKDAYSYNKNSEDVLHIKRLTII